ncbi:MAG: hypothetical protein ACLSGS_07175, partial [Adlercreutzia sp.]
MIIEIFLPSAFILRNVDTVTLMVTSFRSCRPGPSRVQRYPSLARIISSDAGAASRNVGDFDLICR